MHVCDVLDLEILSSYSHLPFRFASQGKEGVVLGILPGRGESRGRAREAVQGGRTGLLGSTVSEGSGAGPVCSLLSAHVCDGGDFSNTLCRTCTSVEGSLRGSQR